MIFAGTKKKAYSYKELEEVKDIPSPTIDNSVKCRYCDTIYDRDTNHKCPNCAAIN
jgi:rubrerythrin